MGGVTTDANGNKVDSVTGAPVNADGTARLIVPGVNTSQNTTSNTGTSSVGTDNGSSTSQTNTNSDVKTSSNQTENDRSVATTQGTVATQSTSDLLTAHDRAALNSLIDTLSTQDKNGKVDFNKQQAITDSTGLINQIFQNYREQNLPQILSTQNRAGGYDSSGTQLLADDAFARTEAQGLSAITDTISKYAGIQSQQDASLNAALGVAKGSYIDSNSTQTTNSSTITDTNKQVASLIDTISTGQTITGATHSQRTTNDTNTTSNSSVTGTQRAGGGASKLANIFGLLGSTGIAKLIAGPLASVSVGLKNWLTSGGTTTPTADVQTQLNGPSPDGNGTFADYIARQSQVMDPADVTQQVLKTDGFNIDSVTTPAPTDPGPETTPNEGN